MTMMTKLMMMIQHHRSIVDDGWYMTKIDHGNPMIDDRQLSMIEDR